MKRKRHKKRPSGLIFVFLGIGIVLVCIFPTEWMLVLLAIALIAAGIMLMTC